MLTHISGRYDESTTSDRKNDNTTIIEKREQDTSATVSLDVVDNNEVRGIASLLTYQTLLSGYGGKVCIANDLLVIPIKRLIK